MAGEGQLIAGSAVSGKHQGIIHAKVSNFPMSQLVKVFRCFLTGQQIIIVNINGLIGELIGFSYEYIQKAFVVEDLFVWNTAQ